ncbi:MAG: alpha/beta fold hydrolase [Acidobacteria bacterium]|nr:alpha/beta fold hydrolase [Acidobacteriota bacterium]
MTIPMRAFLCVLLVAGLGAGASAQPFPESEGDFVIPRYTFRNGQTLQDLRLHYRTIGTPIRDAAGHIRNGVLIMHGSSGDASQVLAASMRGPLVGPGLPLDPATHFLIYPDILGAGKSSKPSDGLRAAFPKYGYHDLVDLEHRLVTEHFGIERLRLVMGISMGGMHTWLWGIRYPSMMDGLLPISSLPVKVDGRNLLWRRILVNAIRTDPAWMNGNYTEQPRGFLNIMPMFDMLVQSPSRLAERLNTYDAADAYVREVVDETLDEDDANNILYRFEASFDYDPAADLHRITAPLLAILFADDELNPIELGVIEPLMAQLKNGRHIIVPAGSETEAHRTQVKAAIWARHVGEFMKGLAR